MQVYKSDGKLILRDGKVGTEQGCCCGGECECDGEYEITIKGRTGTGSIGSFTPGSAYELWETDENGMYWETFSGTLTTEPFDGYPAVEYAIKQGLSVSYPARVSQDPCLYEVTVIRSRSLDDNDQCYPDVMENFQTYTKTFTNGSDGCPKDINFDDIPAQDNIECVDNLGQFCGQDEVQYCWDLVNDYYPDHVDPDIQITVNPLP